MGTPPTAAQLRPPGPGFWGRREWTGEAGSTASAGRRGRLRRPAFSFSTDGLDETLRQQAQAVWSFGAATMPHQIVRILAAEQIYRAMTILSGHPYHRV
ncbi:MAG: 23S rRNA (pseudouridine(1915)-N(3))-methyltransferase RlmH [Burkholderiales bacterium]|nr:23S rRNA (pseudouridine(1915)-N(3))-methyltransferase RlmH [Burkholderiales bacterium]